MMELKSAELWTSQQNIMPDLKKSLIDATFCCHQMKGNDLTRYLRTICSVSRICVSGERVWHHKVIKKMYAPVPKCAHGNNL